MFDNLISVASLTWDVPESWIKAVIQTESNWNPDATGSIGERGLMQISPSTAALYGWDFTQMYDPSTNIDAGTHLLHDLRTSYGDDFRRVYSAYNSGNPNAWQTSTQVAANVNRALDNLAQFEGSTSTAGGGILLAILAVALFWGLRR